MAFKRNLIALFIVLLILRAGVPVYGKTVEISGRLKLYLSMFLTANPEGDFFTHEAGEFALRRLESRLSFAGLLTEKISYKLRFDAYTSSGDLMNDDRFPESGILGSPQLSEYLELNIYEGAVKVTDFLLKNLDFTVGKQRIYWGTADKVNVVDNLNPIDIANFFSFDPDHAFERRPQTAINLEYYLGKVTRIQLVWLLAHQISPLPYGFTFLTLRNNGLASIAIEKDWTGKLEDTNFGVRLSTNIFNLDVGFSYYHGNASIPVLRTLSIQQENQGTFFYPDQEIWGLDLSGEIGGVGFWAETALILPDETQSSISTTRENSGVIETYTQTFPLFEKNYLKFVIGLDYNFGKGFYVNIQFLHGFFEEFDYSDEAKGFFNLKEGMFFGELEDYLIGQVQYSSSGNNLKLSLNWITEIADSLAIILMPALELKISDGLLIQTGAFLLASGDESTTKFGTLRNDKLLYLGCRLDF